MPKFTKKPVEIEAVEWNGDNISEMTAFLNGGAGKFCFGSLIEIKTLEGTMTAKIGDWVIKGVKGEFYPCKPDIFAATYDPVLPPNPIVLR